MNLYSDVSDDLDISLDEKLADIETMAKLIAKLALDPRLKGPYRYYAGSLEAHTRAAMSEWYKEKVSGGPIPSETDIIEAVEADPALDLSKPVQTRGNDKYKRQPVELITIEGRSEFPVCGYIGQEATPVAWKINGGFSYDGVLTRYDLINIPQRQKSWWVNIRESITNDHASFAYRSKEEADKYALSTRISCVEITPEMIEKGRVK